MQFDWFREQAVFSDVDHGNGILSTEIIYALCLNGKGKVSTKFNSIKLKMTLFSKDKGILICFLFLIRIMQFSDRTYLRT